MAQDNLPDNPSFDRQSHTTVGVPGQQNNVPLPTFVTPINPPPPTMIPPGQVQNPYEEVPPLTEPPWERNPHTKLGTLDTPQPDICCIGFNHEDSKLEAIIKVPIGWVPSDWDTTMPDCPQDRVARVGFWIVLGGSTFFCSEGDIHIRKEPNPNPIDPGDPFIYYSIHECLIPDLQSTTDGKIITNFWSNILQCSPSGPVIAQLWCALKITHRDDYTTFTWKEVQNIGDALSGTSPNPIDPINDFNNAFVKMQPTFKIQKKLIQFPLINSLGKFDFTLRAAPSAIPSESQVFPMHAAILKNKKILLFSGSGNIGYNFDGSNNLPIVPPSLKHTAALFDPDSETIQELPPPPTYLDDTSDAVTGTGTSAVTSLGYKKLRYYDMFCSGHSVIADGRVLIVGGTEEYTIGQGAFHHDHFPGVKLMAYFDPETSSWSLAPKMNHGRWYPSTLVLSDGNVFIYGGHVDLDYTVEHTNSDLEIFNPYINPHIPGKNPWFTVEKTEPTTEQFFQSHELPGNYPKIFLLPNGQIFCASLVTLVPPEKWDIANGTNDITSGKPGLIYFPAIIRWSPYDHLNPITQVKPMVTIVNRGGIVINTAGNPTGGVTSPFDKNIYPIGLETFSQIAILLPLFPPDYSPTIMILKFDKAFKCSPLSQNTEWQDAHRELGGLVLDSNDINKNPVERLNGNGVLLPDATVLFIGGVQSTNGEGILNAHAFDQITKDNPNVIPVPVLPVEIFDPLESPGNQWSIGAKGTRSRNYHSIAVLLYDGRILLASSDIDCGLGQTAQDLSYDIYTPDCLFRGPRPVFSHSEDVIAHGSTFNIRLGKGWQVGDINTDKIGLIRCYSATHATGFDQRYVALQVAKPMPKDADVEFTVQVNSNDNILPPGYYYLFLVSRAGAPSIGHIIKIFGETSIAFGGG
jgi:hypothetical protein